MVHLLPLPVFKKQTDRLEAINTLKRQGHFTVIAAIKTENTSSGLKQNLSFNNKTDK